MYDFKQVKEAVEAEYDAYVAYRRDEGAAELEEQIGTYDASRMFELLSEYLTWVVKSLTRANTAINEYDIEDIVNDAVTDIIGGGLKRFQKEGALFTTFCYAIAKNKVRDFQRKNCHVCLEETENLQRLSDRQIGQAYRESEDGSPEHQVLLQERRLEAILFLKNYIKTLMSWKCGPIRKVACSFSLILYHRYSPDSKRKASPKWAYEQLERVSVGEGSKRFSSEMTEWMPGMAF